MVKFKGVRKRTAQKFAEKVRQLGFKAKVEKSLVGGFRVKIIGKKRKRR